MRVQNLFYMLCRESWFLSLLLIKKNLAWKQQRFVNKMKNLMLKIQLFQMPYKVEIEGFNGGRARDAISIFGSWK